MDDKDRDLYNRFANLHRSPPKKDGSSSVGKTGASSEAASSSSSSSSSAPPTDDDLLARLQKLNPNSSVVNNTQKADVKQFLLPPAPKSEAQQLDELLDEVHEHGRLELLEQTTPAGPSDTEHRLNKLKNKHNKKLPPTEEEMARRLEKLTGKINLANHQHDFSPATIIKGDSSHLSVKQQVELILAQAMDSNDLDAKDPSAAASGPSMPAEELREHRSRGRRREGSLSSSSSNSSDDSDDESDSDSLSDLLY